MKRARILTFAAAAAVSMAAFAADNTTNSIVPPAPIHIMGGPGIVMSGSTNVGAMPHKALVFLKKNYPTDSVSKCTTNFVKQTTTVQLADGTTLAFDKNGDVDGAVAALGQSLPEAVVAGVLPAKSVDHLRKAGVLSRVSEVVVARNTGYAALLINGNPPQVVFDVDGNLYVASR